MIEILLLLVVPILIVVSSMVVANLRVLAKLVALVSWLQLGIVIWVINPALFHADTILAIAPGFAVDHPAALFLLTTVVTAGALTHAQFFFEQEQLNLVSPEPRHIRQFYMLSSLFFVSMMAVYLCDNLGYLWISVEATTLLSAGLVYFARTRHALEATWKYFIICSVGIAFALLGTILVFASSQYAAPQGALNVSNLINLAPQLNVTLFKLGFIFCFIGYGTKAGIFPLHSWLPDAHSEAPAPASAILSGSLLNCALFAIWRLCQIAPASQLLALNRDLVVWAGCITVVAASLFLVRQHGLKRLWAYSSIENVGLMLVAIGLSSPALFFLQAVNHSLAKVALFLLSGNIIQSTKCKHLDDIRGVLSFAPAWGILLTLAALAITGVPPFGSFISEWLILTNNINLKQNIPALLLILGLTLSFIAISVHMAKILLGTPKHGVSGFRPIASSLVPAIFLTCSLWLGLTISPNSWWGIIR